MRHFVWTRASFHELRCKNKCVYSPAFRTANDVPAARCTLRRRKKTSSIPFLPRNSVIWQLIYALLINSATLLLQRCHCLTKGCSGDFVLRTRITVLVSRVVDTRVNNYSITGVEWAVIEQSSPPTSPNMYINSGRSDR